MTRRSAARVTLSALVLVLAGLPAVAPAQDARPAAPAPRTVAVMTMAKGGEVTIEFFPADAPKTVENFITLARTGFYDGTTFHRVEKNPPMVQGGDPLSKTLKPGDPRLGTGGPGHRVKAEFNAQRHVRGVIAMARSSDPDSAGSQFYITREPAHFLDGQYTVFGKVVSGMDVVDRIQRGDRIASIKIVTR
jgi:peptidyl-prolyl cis-trans isomerase B (cyclophilin B)